MFSMPEVIEALSQIGARGLSSYALLSGEPAQVCLRVRKDVGPLGGRS